MAVEVFPGNTADPLTLGPQMHRLKAVPDPPGRVVGDRGMVATTRIAAIEQQGYGLDYRLPRFLKENLNRRRYVANWR